MKILSTVLILFVFAASFLGWLSMTPADVFTATSALNYYSDMVYQFESDPEQTHRYAMNRDILGAIHPAGMVRLSLRILFVYFPQGGLTFVDVSDRTLIAASIGILVYFLLAAVGLVRLIFLRLFNRNTLGITTAILVTGLSAAYWYLTTLSPDKNYFAPMFAWPAAAAPAAMILSIVLWAIYRRKNMRTIEA